MKLSRLPGLLAIVTVFNVSYHFAIADPCGCEKSCYHFDGVGAINPATSDIVCGGFDPFEAKTTIWVTNGYGVGGPVIKDGMNTYDYVECDTNQCQLYCIPCHANQLQISDPITGQNGCRDLIQDLQRHVCDNLTT